MKGQRCSTNVYDFLKDAQGFLEQTLASEKLSRTALEHRTRLTTKLSEVMREFDNHQMEMYIDMSPTLKSFFNPSDGSTSDNSSIRETVPASEEFYDVPNLGTMELPRPVRPSEDQCDFSVNKMPAVFTFPPPPPPESKKKGFMQRLLKNNSKASVFSFKPKNQLKNSDNSDADIPAFYDDARSAPPEDLALYDDATCLPETDVLYDDAGNTNPSVEEAEIYDDASRIERGGLLYDDAVASKQSARELYDDASRTLKPSASNKRSVSPVPPNDDTDIEEYDYAPDGDVSQNNDSDKISVKSGASEYEPNNAGHRWHIPASEAKTQALRHGFMKRRNGQKRLLAAWRHCFSVLLPAHLLMYANEEDRRPRIIIDLSVPNMEVKRLLKQGADTKRLKSHPFVLLYEKRPLYEMCTKTREEADEWIVALQAVLSQTPDVVIDPLELSQEKLDDDEDSCYEDPSENEKQNKSRMQSIQGRNLPSLPTEQENRPPAKKDSKPSGGKFTTLFRFSKSKSSSSEEEQTTSHRRSVDSSTNTDDLYQELPSPCQSMTPYSSVENLRRSSDDIYNSLDDVSNRISTHKALEQRRENMAICSAPNGVIQHARSHSDSLVSWPKPPPLPSVRPEEDLPVYDIPSPNIRPLSGISLLSDECTLENGNVFANEISRQRARILQQQKSKQVESLEVYDVPASNPRRISPLRELVKANDTPPQAVIPPPENKPFAPKMARFWHEKIGQTDEPSNSFKKDKSPPTKCLPKTSTETKSVGRSFTRLSPQRAPLSSLTEIISSASNGAGLKPALLKKPTDKLPLFKPLDSVVGPSTTNQRLKINNNANVPKKEPPPRPPAPIRTTPTKKEASNGEQIDLASELSRRLAQRSAEIENTSSTSNDKPASKSEQYRARWAYVATNHLELSINSGEVVQVLTKAGPSWTVKARGKKGLVPKEYLVSMTSKSLSLIKHGESPVTV